MPEYDVLIVGGGPAGIAAACAAAESGRRTGLLDDNAAPGGQIWRGDPAAPWLARLRAAGVVVHSETCVVDVPQAGVVVAESASFGYDKLILATGARERFLPFPGWTLPNVTGAGGLQALVKGGLPVEGKRVVVAGTGPLLLAVAAYLRKRGAIVPVIAEQAPWRRLIRFGATLPPGKWIQAISLRSKLPGVRYAAGCWPVSVEGDGRVEAAVLHRADRTWRE
ncbi:MAG: NAD(P)/FAD-dependent oxidoreductase, partial [Bryobacteraceae bacterium]